MSPLHALGALPQHEACLRHATVLAIAEPELYRSDKASFTIFGNHELAWGARDVSTGPGTEKQRRKHHRPRGLVIFQL